MKSPLQNKKTRTTCAAWVNQEPVSSIKREHAQDPGHELAAEKVHPSALAVEEGHALETVALDLYRHAHGRPGAVVLLRRVRCFLIHSHVAIPIPE